MIKETTEDIKLYEKMAMDTGEWKRYPLSSIVDSKWQDIINEYTEHNMNLIREARLKFNSIKQN